MRVREKDYDDIVGSTCCCSDDGTVGGICVNIYKEEVLIDLYRPFGFFLQNFKLQLDLSVKRAAFLAELLENAVKTIRGKEMRSIIGGLIYDTEKAKQIADYEPPVNRGDFQWYSESLYVTAKGNWFLVGEGNAMSPYSCREGSGRGPGSRLRPLSNDDAQAWLEERREVEALEEYFADKLEEA